MATARSFFLPSPVAIPRTHWDGELAADVFAPCGTPVLAPYDGVARPAIFSLGGYTNRVVADDGTEFYVAHMLDAGRVSGRVQAGDVIGYVGESGNAAGKGCHTHIAIGRINSNGGGTIRPVDFFNGTPTAPTPADDNAPAGNGPASPANRWGTWSLLVIGGIAYAAWSLIDEF